MTVEGRAQVGAQIAVSGLSHTYRSPDGPLKVLDDVSFTVPSGGYVALTGPSGAGKSTLLSIMGGLETAQVGSVEIGGYSLAQLKGGDLARYRRNIVGFVFQHFGLLDALSAAENVELACTLSGVKPKLRRKRAADLLASVGLADRSAHRPLQMSGGERQRVAIARALANEPALLLADEPTGNLDEQTAEAVIGMLEQVSREQGVTLVVVTHNSEIAARSPLSIAMDHGHVSQAEASA